MVTIIFLLLSISNVTADMTTDLKSDFDSVLLPIWLMVMVVYSFYIISNLDDDKDLELYEGLMSKVYQDANLTPTKSSLSPRLSLST